MPLILEPPAAVRLGPGIHLFIARPGAPVLLVYHPSPDPEIRQQWSRLSARPGSRRVRRVVGP